jgi:polyisoprenoid-binding protein YceI
VFWSKRGKGARRSDTGRNALVPIPLTGGLLSGQVQDGEGRPLAGAQVSVLDRASTTVVNADTDPFGYFTAALVPGEYRVRAEAGGYRGNGTTVEVEWGKHAEVGALSLAPDQSLTPPPPGIYDIDPDHSSIRFIARHIGMSRVYGRFNRFRGQIRIAEPFEDSAVDIVIDAVSVDTNVEARDTHLRSPDFLDVERFPQLRFSSTRFRRGPGNRWLVDGDLTLHGLTSDVQLDVTFLGMEEWNGRRAGAVATAELHREHFTLNWQQMVNRGVPVVGSTIEINLDVQAVLQG